MIAASILAAFLGILTGCVIMLIHVSRHPKQLPSLTKYVAFSIAILIIYTITELIVSSKTGILHENLTTCIFACFGGEILTCGLIKIFKLKEENTDDSNI